MLPTAELRAVSLHEKGTDFVRGLIAKAVNETPLSASEYASSRWGPSSRVTKAAVEVLHTDTAGAVGSEGAAEFFASVAQNTIIAKLSGLRRVPLRVRTLVSTGAVAHWTGEGQMKPLTTMAFSAGLLEPLKIVALTVVSQELLRDDTLTAEALIRGDLMRATSEALDVAFIDPANAGTVGVTPASVTNGATPVAATSSPTEDMRDLVADFDGDLAVSYLVMHPVTAVSLAGETYPNIGARGGSLLGVPVLVSRSVPAGVVALLDPTGIALAEGAASGRTIVKGDVLMADSGTMAAAEAGSPSGAIAATLVSLWQTDCVALVAERVANWAVVRAGAVSVLTGATYNEGSP